MSQPYPSSTSSRVRPYNGPPACKEEASEHIENLVNILAGKFRMNPQEGIDKSKEIQRKYNPNNYNSSI
jgi:hypothetical protein